MRTLKTSTAIILFLVLADLCAVAQPTYFMIGCDYVHHRSDQWTGIRDTFDLPFNPALQRARELGLNTVMIHPVGLTGYDTLVQKLVTKSHDVGLRTIIHDDSLRQLTVGERRIYQAEAAADFSYRSQDVSIITDANFDDGQNFDLLAEKRSNPPPRPANVIRLSPGVTQTGLVLSGFTHKREIHRDSIIYYFSIKMRLAGTQSLDLNDSLIRIVFRVNNTRIDTTLFGGDFHDGNDFITDVREIFLGSFYIDSSAAQGFHLDRIYEPQNVLQNFPAEPRSKDRNLRFTIADTCSIEMEVHYFGHGIVHIDQLNLSNFSGWGMFVGDEHSAPIDQMQQGQTVTPRRQRLEYRITSYPVTGDIPYISMTETWFAEGSLSLVGLVSNLIRNRFNNQTDALFYMNRYSMYGLTADPYTVYDSLSAKRQLTEGNARTLFPYFYMIEYNLPNPNTNPTLYYNDSVQALYFKPNIIDMKRLAQFAGPLQRGWINTVQNHSWAFRYGGPGIPEPGIESREPLASELRLQCNLGLCYGSKGVLYYHYGTIEDSVAHQDHDIGCIGFMNTDRSARTVDTHNENKWDSTRALNLFLAEMGVEIMPLVWMDGYSWRDYATTGRDTIKWVVTERLGSSVDPATARFVEIGLFRSQPVDPNSFYIFVVNRRTDTLGGRHITVKLGYPLTDYWKVTNVLSEESWIVNALSNQEDTRRGGFTDYFKQGSAALYRVERIVFNGDGNPLTGCQPNNLYITKGAECSIAGGSITFEENRHLFIEGKLEATNVTFGPCSTSWKGIYVRDAGEFKTNPTSPTATCTLNNAPINSASNSIVSLKRLNVNGSPIALLASVSTVSTNSLFTNNVDSVAFCLIDCNAALENDSLEASAVSTNPTRGIVVQVGGGITMHGIRISVFDTSLSVISALVESKGSGANRFGANKLSAGQVTLSVKSGGEIDFSTLASHNSISKPSSSGYHASIFNGIISADSNYWSGTSSPKVAPWMLYPPGASLSFTNTWLMDDPVPFTGDVEERIAQTGSNLLPQTMSISLLNSYRRRLKRGDTTGVWSNLVQFVLADTTNTIPESYMPWLIHVAKKKRANDLKEALAGLFFRRSSLSTKLFAANLFATFGEYSDAIDILNSYNFNPNRSLLKNSLYQKAMYYPLSSRSGYEKALRSVDSLQNLFGNDFLVRHFVETYPALYSGLTPPTFPRLRKENSIAKISYLIPSQIELYQNYPNPFSSVSGIIFRLPEDMELSIDLFDIFGRRIRNLAQGSYSKGTHTLLLNAEGLNNGTYLYRLTTKDIVLSQKMVILK